jgi:hypothetical protein
MAHPDRLMAKAPVFQSISLRIRRKAAPLRDRRVTSGFLQNLSGSTFAAARAADRRAPGQILDAGPKKPVRARPSRFRIWP